MLIGKKAVLFLSTGFFIGYIPVAPGTFGSLLGLALAFFLARINLLIAIIAIALFILGAIWIAEKAGRFLKQNDPGCIVIDEVAGMLVTLTGLPFTFLSAISAFILFRILDILKPPPIRWVEKKISGGAGIVLDDILAGFIANITLRILFQSTDII